MGPTEGGFVAFIKSMLTRRGGAASMARAWIRSASRARTSVKFILLMLAVLLPVGVMLLQLSPKAAQVDAVNVGSVGKILIAGGQGDSGGLASTELYDPATNSFAPANQTSSMNMARSDATGAVLTTGPNVGNVLIAGGGQFIAAFASTELYSPASNSFAPANETASMNIPRGAATATTITTGPNAGKILIAGGQNSSTNTDLASTELYNPTTNTFASALQTASMNNARVFATATTITTGPNVGDILITGGYGPGPNVLSNDLYDPTTNSFAPVSQTPSMNSGHVGATATLITAGPNAGKILIAGGGTASTDLYDPITNSFAPANETATMNASRSFATATTITTGPNAGKVLIAGGSLLASTDLYDPATNTFAPAVQTASMNTARQWATATLLNSGPNAGKILIAGGEGSTNNSETELASTELYDPATNTFAPANQTASMNSGRFLAVAVELPEPTPISFVASGTLADSAQPVSAVTLTVPVGIQSGDVLLAQIVVYDGSGTNVPVSPTGWTLIRHDGVSNQNKMTSWLFYKVASNEPASYAWNITPQFAAGVMGAWRGASIVSSIDQASGGTASGVGVSPISDAAPSLTPTNDNELQIYFYGSQSGSAPTIIQPQAIVQRSNTKSGKEGFALAFGDLAAPPGGDASATYAAMAVVSNGTLAMTAQAVLLVPANASPPSPSATPTSTPTMTIAPSPNGTPPPTPFSTLQPTIIPTPGGSPPPPTPATPFPTPGNTAPRFVATGALTDSAQPLTSVTVSLPPNVIAGDLLVAQIALWDGSGTNVPVAPAGWTSIRDDSISNSNKITSWLYYHVAGGSEPASYSWRISAQYAVGVMGAWRGASSSSPIDKTSGATAAGPSPLSDAAPSLTPAINNELQIYFYGSQSIAAPTISEPGAITQRANIKSSKEGFTLAFGDLAAPSEGTASPTYVATASFPSGTPVMAAQAVLLRPGP
jgi:hypothetical protein